MPGVRSTDVPATPFQPLSSTSNAARSHGSTSSAANRARISNCTSPSQLSRRKARFIA